MHLPWGMGRGMLFQKSGLGEVAKLEKLGFVEVVKIEKSEVAKLETPGGGLVCSSSRNWFKWFDQPLNTDTRDERK